MTSGIDNKKEWFSKARLDYFSPFVILWLACNSWYNFHYAALNGDRAHIDQLKKDVSSQNVLFQNFKKLYEGGPSKERVSFLSNLELLQFSLSRAALKPDKLKYPLSFERALFDFNQKDIDAGYIELIVANPKRKNGTLRKGVNGIDLGDLVLINQSQQVFACLLEIIYQVRCMLVHGALEPTDDNHEVVKYCYLLLYDMMRKFCA